MSLRIASLHCHQNIVQRSAKYCTRLAHNYTTITTSRIPLIKKSHSSINSNANLQANLNTTSRTQNGRSYCDEKVRRTSRILQQIRSTLNKLFIFGDWRMEDIYALYLLGFFGGLLILFLRIEWKGGFSENFDKIDKSVKSDKITQVVKND